MKSRSKIQVARFWKDHSESWKASNMAQKAYCEEKGLNYRSFVYQHTRLLRQAKKDSLKFIETKPEPAATSVQSTGMLVMLPNGIRISISAELNQTLLQTILTMVGAISC